MLIMLDVVLSFLFEISGQQLLLLLSFLTLIFAARQLRWTRLDTAVAEWTLVDVDKYSHKSKNREEYTVNAYIQNSGKGIAHNVNAKLFQSDVKLNELDEENDETKKDVIRDLSRSIGGRRVVNPGEKVKVNFRVRQLDKLNDVVIRMEPEKKVHGYVRIKRNQIDSEYRNMFYSLKSKLSPSNYFRNLRNRLRNTNPEVM